MDSLEQQAQGTPPASPAPTKEPGQQAPSPANIQDTPEFKDAVKGFQADYTQKTQALAEGRNVLQAERDAFAQERLTHLEATNRPQGDTPAQTLSQKLPAHVQEGLDPAAAQVLDLIGAQTAMDMAPLRESMTEMQETIERQNAALNSVQNQAWAKQKQQEILEVQAKYGKELVQQNEENITQMLQSNPNLSVEQALMASSPDAYREQIRAEETAKAQEAIQLQYGASLQGIVDAPGAAPTPAFQEGEGFAQSAKRNMGAAAYNENLITDALNS